MNTKTIPCSLEITHAIYSRNTCNSRCLLLTKENISNVMQFALFELRTFSLANEDSTAHMNKHYALINA